MLKIINLKTYLITHFDVFHKIYTNRLENVQNHESQNVFNNTFRCDL